MARYLPNCRLRVNINRENGMNETITINGVEHTPTTAVRGSRAVIVVDRGWIFAGDVTEKDGRIYLSRAVWVFRWESVGFAAVVADPKGSKADIRPIDDLDIPKGSEIFRIPVGDDWGL
jgi:hypothetical protein